MVISGCFKSFNESPEKSNQKNWMGFEANQDFLIGSSVRYCSVALLGRCCVVSCCMFTQLSVIIYVIEAHVYIKALFSY